MFCKYCGSKIDPEATNCPNCGKTIRLEGGNGFWDMAGEPRPTHPSFAPPPAEKERIVVKEVTKWSKIPIVIGAFLCVVGLVLFAAGKISSGKELKALKADYEAKLSQQEAKYESQISEMESSPSDAEESLSQALTPKQPVEVLHRPSSEEQQIGCADRNIFVFRINGAATSFTWEKLDADGTWQELQFSNDGVDERYGLKLVEDLQRGESILRAVGLTADCEGTYRCTAYADGGSASADVTLSILRNENEEEDSTPQESIEPSDEPDPDAEDAGSNDSVDESDNKSKGGVRRG